MKSLARLISLTLLLLGLAASPTAAVELRWEPRWQSVAPGADGSVSIIMDDALDFRTIEVWIQYDPNVVTGVTSTPGSAYDGVGCFLWEDYEEAEPGLFHAYVVIMGGECYATGPGELLVWHFTAMSLVDATDLVPVDVYVSDPQADPLPDLSLGPATIAVNDPPSGTPQPAPDSSLRLAPNPFNPSTRLTISTHTPGSARLVVFDAAGRDLGTVWSGSLGSAPVDITWDGNDASGRALPSGTYLFQLTAPGSPPRVVRGLLLR